MTHKAAAKEEVLNADGCCKVQFSQNEKSNRLKCE